MRRRSRIGNVPARLAAGAFILNSGLGKLSAEKETAQHLHGFAAGTYPMLENVPPEQFARDLAMVEVALGGALLLPIVVSDRLAGLGLTAFAGGLFGLYARTPGMRQEGSWRPTQEGIPLAKDIWLVGIGLSLVASSLSPTRAARRAAMAKVRREAAAGAA